MNELDYKIQTILRDVRGGKPVLIADSVDREGEIDIFLHAANATAELLTFMIKKASGLMCITMTPQIANNIGIPALPTNKNDKFSTPFRCPIDAKEGVSTGMSAEDRLVTISKILHPNATLDDFSVPGHLQTLVAKPQLLNERTGHTECSIQLCLLAGMYPIGLIVEIVKDNGEMAKTSDLQMYSNGWGFNSITVDEVQQYCHDHELHFNVG